MKALFIVLILLVSLSVKLIGQEEYKNSFDLSIFVLNKEDGTSNSHQTFEGTGLRAQYKRVIYKNNKMINLSLGGMLQFLQAHLYFALGLEQNINSLYQETFISVNIPFLAKFNYTTASLKGGVRF